MTGVIGQITAGFVESVLSGAMLYPLEVDETARIILRGMPMDIEFLISDKVAIGAPPPASRTQWFRLNRRVVIHVAPKHKKRSDAVSEPQRCKNIGHRLRQSPGEVALSIHEGHIGRHSMGSPNFKNAPG